MEWLALWGIQTTVGFLFTPVMQKFAEDLGKDVLKDILKDVIKDLPGNILQSLQKEEIDQAVGKAIKEFLEILQHELIAADLSDDEVKQYNSSLTKFLRIDKVKELLGSAFDPECESINTQSLEKIWYEQNLLAFPANFDWRRLNKPYIKKVKAIIRESDKLRNAFDSHQLEKTANNAQELVGVPSDFDLRCYQEGIRQKYGYLKLDSLDTSGSAYNDLKLQQVFIAQNVRECVEILPHVFERSKEYHKYLQETGKETKSIDTNELERYQKRYIEAPIRSVIGIINEKQNRNYLVILGNPGAGKSTLLQYLALNWAESKLTNYFNQPIPILIELRTYARQFTEKHCKNFLEYLHDAPGTICHLNQLKLHEQLQKGNALVMFDGLDEVFNPAQREDIINDIIRFTDKYPDVQVIVTSRVIGYKDERFRNSEFRHLMLQDFDDEQIQDFINRWHQLTFNDKSDAADKKARLERGIERSKAIKELAGNPLLLTMMGILNRHRELPRDRSTLYEKASEVLLQQWDAERHLTNAKMSRFPIDLSDKQAMLRQVAYQMQANEKGLTGNLINGNDLQQIFQGYLEPIDFSKIDAREAAKILIEELRQRNFILCHAGDNYYAFVHRTFLEYFCAEAFRWQFEKEQKLNLKQMKTEVFGKHWDDESWHEVLRLIAGVINVKFVVEIIDYLRKINGEKAKFANIFLAVDCFAELRNRQKIDVMDVLNIELYEHIKDLAHYTHYEYIYDSMGNIYDEIHGEHERQIGLDINVKAVQKLGNIWKENPETLPILKDLSINSEYLLQYCSILEIADNFNNCDGVLAWLKDVPTKVGGEIAIMASLEGIGRYFKEDPTTLPLLKNIASNDEYEFARCHAIEVLARNFRKDSNIFLFLQQCTQIDACWSVRCKALEELVSTWKNNVNLFKFFCDVAVNDPFQSSEDEHGKYETYETNPRQTALEIILKHFPNHSQTLPLLRDRIHNDPDEKLREWAKDKLQKFT
jgi:predicted NACHT family NTPase